MFVTGLVPRARGVAPGRGPLGPQSCAGRANGDLYPGTGREFALLRTGRGCEARRF